MEAFWFPFHQLVDELQSRFFGTRESLKRSALRDKSPEIPILEVFFPLQSLQVVDVGPLSSCEKHVLQGTGATQSLEYTDGLQVCAIQVVISDAVEVDDTGQELVLLI